MMRSAQRGARALLQRSAQAPRRLLSERPRGTRPDPLRGSGGKPAAEAAESGGGGAAVKLAAAGAVGATVYYNNEAIRGAAPYWSLADAGAKVLREGISDAEDAHSYALQLLGLGLGPVAPQADASLKTEVFGITFASPVGVAAGFDKRGLAHAPLGEMGFGFVEVGGVTPLPQPGNDRPRVFRLKNDRSVVNFVGLPSEGADVVAARLKSTKRTCVVGANVTKNAASTDAVGDHARVVKALDGAVDFVVVNASCPNVKGGVVDVKAMAALVAVARENTSVPVLLKISPDLDERQRRTVAHTALKLKLDGLVVANTTSRRPHRDSSPPLFKTPLRSADVPDRGGLSGPPLIENTKAIVHDFYRKTKGRVPIVGVGGVSSADDAYALICAGASLLQLYTALVYHGPGLGCEIRDGLVARAKKDGFARVQDAVGSDHRRKKGWF